jgi:hypothetical protein
MSAMAYLIDGKALLAALCRHRPDTGRPAMCGFLHCLLEQGEQVTVVFDGPPPPGPLARQIAKHAVEVAYAGGRAVGEVIAERIAEEPSPEELTVISDDRRVRRAAHRRRCPRRKAPEFAGYLLSVADSARRRPMGFAPAVRPTGVRLGEGQEWQRVFRAPPGG